MKVTCPQCKRRVYIKRGQNKQCKCGYSIHYMKFFRKKISYAVYLIDANILIYAFNKDKKRGYACKTILEFSSPSIKIGTTSVILDEVKQNKNSIIVDTLLQYSTRKLSEQVQILKTNYLKQPSPADLSLIQTALEHAEIIGIITYDNDFGRIATQGLIQRKSSTKFWLGNAHEFLAKYEIKKRLSPKQK